MSTDIDEMIVIDIPTDTYTTERDDFLESINTNIRNNVNTIYANCDKLVSFSSSHISLLWEAKQLCKVNNIDFILKNISNVMIEVITVLDLKEYFIIESESSSKCDENNTERITSLEIPSIQSKFIPNVENIVREKFSLDTHLKNTPILHKIIYELETIFYEVCTNIRLHADLNPNDYIEFSLNQVNDSLVLEFIDTGLPFDITKFNREYNSKIAIKARMKNGFGIMMIKNMSTNISYRRFENKNILTVSKSWSKTNG